MIQELKSTLAAEVEKIVQSGTNIRERVAVLTTDGAARFHETTGGLVEIVRAVKEGAVRGAQSSIPDEAESKLRQVIGGLVDGLGTASEAIDLTLKESVSSGKQFANEGLSNARDELEQIKSTLENVMVRTGGEIKSAAVEQIDSLGAHAVAVSGKVIPVFEDALIGLTQNIGKVTRETTRAGVTGIKAGAGALFDGIGSKLSQLGRNLDSKKPN